MTDRPARPLRLAHRGDWRTGPENSLGALVAGARAPRSDGVEFDVRLSGDGVPVVIHDRDLGRVQGVPGVVGRLSAAALSAHGVPTLSEVLAALPRRAFLDVELKEVVGEETVAVLAGARGPELRRAVVSSFELEALRSVARLAAAWPRWLNVVDLGPEAVATAVELECRGVAAEWHAVSAATARLCREAGLELAAWTVRRPTTFERLGRLGVVAVCVEGAALDG